jgi:hypothetical protein
LTSAGASGGTTITCTCSNELARNYDARRAGVDTDLTLRLGRIEPVLARLDPLLLDLPSLTREELDDLVIFIRLTAGRTGRTLERMLPHSDGNARWHGALALPALSPLSSTAVRFVAGIR